MTHDSGTPIIDQAEASFLLYADFVAFELRETAGAAYFQMHHPAPENVTMGRLEGFASTLRERGYNAQLAPLEIENEGYFGIRIVSNPIGE